jgi:hypothetical protein
METYSTIQNILHPAAKVVINCLNVNLYANLAVSVSANPFQTKF